MAAATDADAQVNQQRLKELEVEADELRRSNLRLQLENSELAHQLDSAQIPAKSVIEDPETEALRELGNHLRQQNEDLAKEVERLQEDRCTDVEELIYLRWVNACLRYELHNFQPPLGKTVARDLSKSLSPRSEEKVKKLILEYANTEGIEEKEMNLMDFESYQWPSSQASCITESTDFDDSFLSSKASGSRKKKFFKKLGRLLQGKDIHHQDNGSTLWSEDSDSLCGISCVSTITDTASDLQSNEALTPVLNLSRHSSRHSFQHSMGFQRMKSPKMDDMKAMKSSQRNSNVGSSFGCRRASWGGDFSLERQGEQYLSSLEKAELVKFAEVLKDSGSEIGSSSRTGILHRKSASHSSFETLRHKTTG